jgi:inner membrane transporter RhtA
MTGPAALVLTGIVSVQLGAGVATRLFHQLAPATVTGLRLWSAALILLIVGGRGAWAASTGVAARRAWRDALTAVAFGVCLGLMNYVFYQAIARIPLGVAVTVEFLGPLAVAVAGSRRPVDLLWVALAAAGVVLLTGTGTAHLNAAGIVFAALSAAGWAGYIVLSAATGRRFPGSSGLVIAMLVAALVVTPTAVAAAGPALRRPSVLATGASVGVLSSAIPYGVELRALRRLSTRVFGIWMSLEPAVAALIGLALLGQHLSVSEWAAVGCVVVACVGAARSAPPAPAPSPDLPGPAPAPSAPDLPAPAPAPSASDLPGPAPAPGSSDLPGPALAPGSSDLPGPAPAPVSSDLSAPDARSRLRPRPRAAGR